jgi:tetratricopeptide (TPR) repeat protein
VQLYTSLPKIVGGSESQSKIYANQLLKISKVDGYLALGYVNENNNKPESAEKLYKKALAVGRSEHTYKKLSSFYEKTNQPQKALNNYEMAYADLQRNHLNYLFGKISAVYNISLEMGLVYLKRYIKNFTEKDGVPISWANYRIAQIYRHKDDKRNAYNFIQKALNENPNLEGALTEKKLILMMK